MTVGVASRSYRILLDAKKPSRLLPISRFERLASSLQVMRSTTELNGSCHRDMTWASKGFFTLAFSVEAPWAPGMPDRAAVRHLILTLDRLLPVLRLFTLCGSVPTLCLSLK